MIFARIWTKSAKRRNREEMREMVAANLVLPEGLRGTRREVTAENLDKILCECT